MRTWGIGAAAVLMTVPAAVLPAFSPAAADPIRLDVSPERAVVPATVLLDGACEGEFDGDGMVLPGAEVSLQGADTGEQPVDLDEDGTFTAFPLEVPAQLQAQEYTVRLLCTFSERPPTVTTVPFTVLAAPTLVLDPGEGSTGGSLSVSGTCPRGTVDESSIGPEVRFGDVPLGVARLDGVTGRIGPNSFVVPATAEPAAHAVTTSCGGKGTFTVVATPTTTPPTMPPTMPPTTATPATTMPTTMPVTSAAQALVVVPDLSGRTVAQARAALDEVELVLADPGSADGTVTSQAPEPGELVPAGTVVAVELVTAPGTGTTAGSRRAPPLAALLVGVAALAAVATAVLGGAERARRRRARERSWVAGQVGTALRTGGTLLEDPPAEPGRSLDVSFQLRAGAAPPSAQEDGP
jgi:hypothetical protein